MNALSFQQPNINLDVLENVRTRLNQLQESIFYFLQTINPQLPTPPASWPEFHSKFNVLIAKYVHLTNLLNGPHSTPLQAYTIFPHETPEDTQQVNNLSILLRTKLIPELEVEDEENTKTGDIPGLATTSPIPGTGEERRILAAIKLRISMHDALCAAADEIFENQKDTINPRARYELDSLSSQLNNHNIRGESMRSPEEMDAMNFLDSIESGQIRYLDDWAGSVTEVPEYESDDELDHQWSDREEGFEFHHHIHDLERHSDYYESDESGIEEDKEHNKEEQENVQRADETSQDTIAQNRSVMKHDEEVEDEDEDEDVFMEVATDTLGPVPSSSSTLEDLGDRDDVGQDDSDDEEEMEEVL
ncbi:hypothetical protein BG004_004893 [Podila humilis]|nr:hypothetical protein BG004_004893 [Podila humilis]